jgi:hypothetical protein
MRKQHVRWCGHSIYVNSNHYVSTDWISRRSDQDSIATKCATANRQFGEFTVKMHSENRRSFGSERLKGKFQKQGGVYNKQGCVWLQRRTDLMVA